MKLPKLNQQGITHILAPLLFVLVFAAIGAYVLEKSHAQTTNETASDTSSQIVFRHRLNPIVHNLSGSQSSVSEAPSAMQSSDNKHSGLPDCYKNDNPPVCYYRVNATQYNVTATGASVVLSQAVPRVALGDGHSAMEIMVQDSTGNQMVEFGWFTTYFPKTEKPKSWLFANPWVNWEQKNAGDCGFVQNPSARPPTLWDMDGISGASGKYQINFTNGQWRIRYNDNLLGYFRASCWKGKFKEVHSVLIYGEVASSYDSYYPHTQMGNGIFGTDPGSAMISKYTLIKSSNTPHLTMGPNTDSNAYNHGKVINLTSVHIGGPGY